MKYCSNCNLKVEADIKHCIFCNDLLKFYDNKKAEDIYPTFKRKRKVFLNFFKIVILLNLVSILTVLFIDGSTNGYNNLTYSLIVSASNLYFILAFGIIYMNRRFVSKLIIGSTTSVLYILSIGFMLNDYIWAINFILPFVLISNLILLSMFLIFNRSKWIDYVTTLFIISILGVASILLVIFNVTTVSWPVIVLTALSVAVLLGLVIFSPKELKEDFKRRFHI